MRIRRIIICLMALLVVVGVVSCRKNRYCHCQTTEGEPDTTVVSIDRSMRCKNIKQAGFERIHDGKEETVVYKVSCLEIDADTVATIPPRPQD